MVGLPDEEWGERVAAAIVAEGEPPTLEALRAWARDRLAPYKVPTRLLVVDRSPPERDGKGDEGRGEGALRRRGGPPLESGRAMPFLVRDSGWGRSPMNVSR